MRAFKVKGIEMILNSAAERNDEETIVKMQAVLDGEGQLAAVTLHKSQLLYHIVWPHGGSASDLVGSIKNRLNRYSNDCEKILVFDKYCDISAKDHERKRRAGETIVEYELSILSILPNEMQS